MKPSPYQKYARYASQASVSFVLPLSLHWLPLSTVFLILYWLPLSIVFLILHWLPLSTVFLKRVSSTKIHPPVTTNWPVLHTISAANPESTLPGVKPRSTIQNHTVLILGFPSGNINKRASSRLRKLREDLWVRTPAPATFGPSSTINCSCFHYRNPGL